MSSIHLIKHLTSRNKYYAAASFLTENTFELSDLHVLGQISTEIHQGLVSESTINDKFIDRLKSVSINSFEYLSPSWNEFAKIADEILSIHTTLFHL